MLQRLGRMNGLTRSQSHFVKRNVFELEMKELEREFSHKAALFALEQEQQDAEAKKEGKEEEGAVPSMADQENEKEGEKEKEDNDWPEEQEDEAESKAFTRKKSPLSISKWERQELEKLHKRQYQSLARKPSSPIL